MTSPADRFRPDAGFVCLTKRRKGAREEWFRERFRVAIRFDLCIVLRLRRGRARGPAGRSDGGQTGFGRLLARQERRSHLQNREGRDGRLPDVFGISALPLGLPRLSWPGWRRLKLRAGAGEFPENHG